MHVLLIPSWFPLDQEDLAGSFFLDQAKALREYGHQVGVIAQYPVSLLSIHKGRPKLGTDCSGEVSILRNYFLQAFPKIPFGPLVLWKVAARRQFTKYCAMFGRPDVLHAHSALYGGSIANHLGQEFKIPVVITEHSSAFSLKLLSMWQLRVARKAFSAAGRCIAVSHAMKSEIERLLPEPRRPVEVIPNLVAPRFESMSEGVKWDSCAPPRIVSIGSLDENKSQGDLIVAFAMLLRRGITAELWIVGDGPKRQALMSLANATGTAARIRFFGSVAPQVVPQILTQARVLVISSRYETFGLVAAEALVVGTPVVATRCGGPEDIITHGDGLLVPVAAPDDLAVAIEKVLHSNGSYDRAILSRRARKRFGASVIAEQLTAVYCGLLVP